MLYLHEVIDIVGEGAVPYMEHSVDFKTDAAAGNGLYLFGTWYVMGSTGRWPQVVNIWEMPGGWDDWRRLCASTNVKRQGNKELESWWRQALEYRSGGFDRLMGAAPGSPTIAQLRDEGVKGGMFVHEITQVRPGAALDYLAAVREEWAPVMADHGHRMVGLWEVLLGDSEVCTLWATDLDGHIALGKATDAARGLDADVADDDVDGRLAAWPSRATEWCVRRREELMVPCPRTVMGPDAWPQ
jgi:hypothetical protein